MPFTLLHPAAVVPLARSPLVPSALVAGAVAPDLPYYVSLQWIGGDYNLTLTHDPTSLLWLDPAIALVLLLVFHALLVEPLVALLPDRAAARVAPYVGALGRSLRGRGRGPAVWVLVSVVVGAATHLGWDALTEALGPGRSQQLNLLSDLVGGVVLLAWLRHRWRTSAPTAPTSGRLPPAARGALAGLLVVATVAWTAVRAVAEGARAAAELREAGGYSRAAVLNYVARGAVVDAVVGLVVGLLLLGLLWRVSGAGRTEVAPGRRP